MFQVKQCFLRVSCNYVNVFLIAVEEDNVYESLDTFDSRKSKSTYSTMTLRKKGKHKSAWNITDNFSINLCTVNRLNCDVKRYTEVLSDLFMFA